jgi:hypothetical protein
MFRGTSATKAVVVHEFQIYLGEQHQLQVFVSEQSFNAFHTPKKVVAVRSRSFSVGSCFYTARYSFPEIF